MKLATLLVPLVALIGAAAGQKVVLTEKNGQYCAGMYSKVDWGGPVEPFLKVDLDAFQQPDPATGKAALSLIVFEYQDIERLGVIDPQSGHRRYVCDEELVQEGVCEEDQLNQFLVHYNDSFVAPAKTVLLTELGTNDFSYHVTKTGYYCVAAYNPVFDSSKTSKNKFKLMVNFHNAYGNLPASDIPMLPLYGLLTIVYAVCLSVYLFQIYIHRTELLLLQKYLAAFFTFLTIENLLTWSLYEAENNSKKYPLSAGIQVYIVFISCLNSFKVAFSFFLLMIISLGYGIVYPKLPNKVMDKCKLFSAVQFMALIAFTGLSYYSTHSQPITATTNSGRASDNTIDDDSILFLIVTIINVIMFIFIYFAVLTNMKNTMSSLFESNQIVKFGMYKNLMRTIAGSLILFFVGTVLSTMVVFSGSFNDSIETYWKFNNVINTFWPSVVYFIVFIAIAIIWRPSDTSYLLAASQQIPQNANGNTTDANVDLEQFGGNDFEFDDLGSFDADPFGQGSTQHKAPVTSTGAPAAPNSTSDDDATSNDNPFNDPAQNPFNDPPLPTPENNDGFALSDDEDEDHRQKK